MDENPYRDNCRAGRVTTNSSGELQTVRHVAHGDRRSEFGACVVDYLP